MTQLLTPEVDTSKVPFAITDRRLIQRERYYDKEFFALENEKLWPHVWQVACRLEEIPRVGDYAEYSVAGMSVLVVRTGSGKDDIKAYQNACRHRATELAAGCGNFFGGHIVCPFHGWRWNLAGEPQFPLYGEEGFEPRCMDVEDLKLIECQVGTWANCVFINMDRDAPPLMEMLDPMPSLLDPLNVGEMYVWWWKAAKLKANWKMAMEAFMEGWHVMQTHPQFTVASGGEFPADFLSDTHSYKNGHASQQQGHEENEVESAFGMGDEAEAETTLMFLNTTYEGLDAMVLQKDVHVVEGLMSKGDIPAGQFSAKLIEALYEWNRGAGIPLPDPDPDVLARWASQWFMYPNFMIHPAFGNAIVYRCRPDDPDDPESCIFDFWSVTLFPKGKEPGKPKFGGIVPVDDANEWPLIPRQDFSNIEGQQRGLHTPGFRTVRLAKKWEDGISNMHVELDKYLAR
jgi:phenylpropionate dioxygenase-like ring-hydroxylating dioxygenase large terminal subunit